MMHGSVFAAVLYKTNDCDLMLFSNDARYKNINPTDSVMTLAARITENLAYCGTNFHAPFVTADKPYRRIVILSDMQGWMAHSYYSGGAPSQSFADYKQRTGADPFVYSWDLQGYGQLMFPERNVFCLAGWSEKVFDLFEALEQDKQALVNRIKAVEI